MKSADKSQARLSTVIGSGEIEAGTLQLKTMATGAVSPVALNAHALAAACR